MGQTLSEPVTTKEIQMCQNSEYIASSCSMQGWRVSMEDSHTHLLESPSDQRAAFFAVYDGHGGARVAQFASLHLHKRIVGSDEYNSNDIPSAIRAGFLKLDEDLKHDEETKEQMCGTTAVVVLIKDGKIFCGNAGDSRAVLCQQGKAVPLSFDHKPNNPDEMKRIVNAGGWVDACRVNGNLALSRALGDFIFKTNDALSAEDQVVTAYPDIVEKELTDEHEFIVIACDGIWDVMSNEQVVDFCRERLANGRTPEEVCEEIVDRCLAPDCELSGVGCDNMTVVLVCLLQGLSKEQYLERLQRKSIVSGNNTMNNLAVEQQQAMDAGTSNLYCGGPRNFPDIPMESAGSGAARSSNVNTVEDKPSTETFTTPSTSPPKSEESEDDSPPAEFHVIPNVVGSEK